MNRPVILASGTPQVLLPYDNASNFIKAVEKHRGPLATWTAWVAPKTMKTALVAQQVGMDEDDLRAVNQIPPRMLVKAGSTLLVPRSAQRQADVSEKVADGATMALAHDGPTTKRLAFRAGKQGDSVAAVAKRYRVSAAQVAAWNDVAATAKFAAGSTVVVHLAVRATKAAAVRSASSNKVATKKIAHKRNAKSIKVAAAGGTTKR
jgi:membrane-bound lytic murein transglycosylase D